MLGVRVSSNKNQYMCVIRVTIKQIFIVIIGFKLIKIRITTGIRIKNLKLITRIAGEGDHLVYDMVTQRFLVTSSRVCW